MQVDRRGHYTSPMPSAARRFAATLGELTGGRVGLCAASVSLLRSAATVAVRYSLQRQQFGPPDAPEVAILDYQTQQEKLMPMLAAAYGLGFAKDFLVAQYAEMKSSRDEKLVADVHSLSAGLKAYVTNYTANALSVCRECCGGHGYAAVNRFGAWRSDHDIFKTFEGDNTVLLQQTAGAPLRPPLPGPCSAHAPRLLVNTDRAQQLDAHAGLLLKEYQSRFTGSPVTATYAYLKQLLSSSLPQNPLVTHETDWARLRDPAFLDRTLRYRTARLLQTVAQRLQKHTARVGAFDAWNRCLSHLLALATAHIEWVVYHEFSKAARRCRDSGCHGALKCMSDIYALSVRSLFSPDVRLHSWGSVGAAHMDAARSVERRDCSLVAALRMWLMCAADHRERPALSQPRGHRAEQVQGDTEAAGQAVRGAACHCGAMRHRIRNPRPHPALAHRHDAVCERAGREAIRRLLARSRVRAERAHVSEKLGVSPVPTQSS